MDTSKLDSSAYASPFDHLLHAYVPKDHEIAARQAVYNAAALASLGLLAVGAFYASVVLEPFLSPIFWAVLTGFILHPYKAAVSEAAKRWLEDAAVSESPLVLSSLLGAARSAVLACDWLGCYLIGLWRTLLSVAAVAAVLISLSSGSQNAVSFIMAAYRRYSDLAEFFALLDSLQWFKAALLVGLAALSYLFVFPAASTRRRVALKSLSCFMWLSAAGYVLNNFLATAAFVLGIPVAAYVLFFNKKVEEGDGSSEEEKQRMKPTSLAVLATTVLTSIVPREMKKDVEDAAATGAAAKNDDKQVKTDDGAPGADGDRVEELAPSSRPPPAAFEDTPIVRGGGRGLFSDRRHQLMRDAAGNHYSGSGHRSRRRRLRHQPSSEQREEAASQADGPPPSSNAFLRGVVALCVLMQFYLHPWLLHLLPVPAAVFALRRAWLAAAMGPRFDSAVSAAKDAVLDGPYGDILFPEPVRKLFRFVIGLERRTLRVLPKYVDQMVAAFLIFLGILLLTALVLFLSLELYAETLHVSRGAGAVIVGIANSTTFRHLNSSLHDPSYQQGFEGAMESVYNYGREFISSTVQAYLGDISSSLAASEMTDKLLQLWDRLYQYWLSRKKESLQHGPTVTEGAVSTSFDEIFARLAEEEWNWSSIYAYCKDNMGTLVGVVDQSWAVLKGNLGLLVTVLAEVAKLLVFSGSGVVNFGLSVVVYLTALFYLLSASDGRTYKPMEMLARHGKVLGEGFASAADRAVTGVFILTFKMASFYGLWTYLTHTFFGASVVVLPMLAAAFLAAVPFAGQYVAAAPAALELWLSEGRPAGAAALLACHLLPSYLVDPLIYSEMRQGGMMHPYLTALSVVGGIYYFGAAGAIHGPLVLCGLHVVISVYPSLAAYVPAAAPAPSTAANPGAAGASYVSTPYVRRSESVC